MPTYEIETRFANDYRHLSAEDKRRFKQAREGFVQLTAER